MRIVNAFVGIGVDIFSVTEFKLSTEQECGELFLHQLIKGNIRNYELLNKLLPRIPHVKL